MGPSRDRGFEAQGLASFRASYETYWADGGFDPPANSNRFLREQIDRYCRHGSTVVDLGCGKGATIGRPAVQRGARYFGFDISETAVSEAVRSGLDVRRVEHISATGLPPGCADVVFIVEVLEHLLAPTDALIEARRILRPKGKVIVTTPNAAVWTRRAELLLLGRVNAMGDDLSRSAPWRDPHIRFFTIPTLRAILVSCGFSQVSVGGAEPALPWPRVGERLVDVAPRFFGRRCVGLANSP